MIEAVIFDVDGVLLRSGAFGELLLRDLGLQRAAVDQFWHGPFVQCALGLADLKHEVEPFLKEWGYPGTVEDCLQTWFQADSPINAEVFDLVERLRRQGMSCHLASTQERYRAAYLENSMGLAERFDRRFFSCHLGVKKPQPEFYRQVAAQLGLAPTALLFFDDQQVNVDAARSAGWHAELYTFGDDLRSVLVRHGIVLST